MTGHTEDLKQINSYEYLKLSSLIVTFFSVLSVKNAIINWNILSSTTILHSAENLVKTHQCSILYHVTATQERQPKDKNDVRLEFKLII